MHIEVFATQGDSAAGEVRDWLEVQKAQRGASPDFCAVHASAACDIEQLQKEAAAAGALHGATSCLGVMSKTEMYAAGGAGAGVFAIWDETGDFGSSVKPLADNARAAARQAATEALERADRTGEAPDVIWLSSSPGAEEDVLQGIRDVVGEAVPVLGGSAADNTITGEWSVFDSQDVQSAGVVVSVLFCSKPVAFAFQSGYAPSETTGRVTKADGRRIIEIDGKPALDVYSDWSGGAAPASVDAPTPILAESTMNPLGRPLGSLEDVPYYLLAHPAEAYPDGSFDTFANVEVGEEVCLMEGDPDQLVRRAGRVAKLAMESGRFDGEAIAGALMVYCGGCMLAVRDRMEEVATGVDAALDHAPYLGIFTFGEQGAVLGQGNLHGNLMISCLVFEQ